MNIKQQQFLDNLQKNTEGGAVQPSELLLAVKALLIVLNDFKSELEGKITDTSAESSTLITELNETLDNLEKELGALVGSSEEKLLSQITSVYTKLSDEITRIEQTIPTLPDLTSIENKIAEVEAKIPAIKEEIEETPEETRDKLEKLKDDERLDISAIKGIGKRLGKLTDDIIARAISIVDSRSSFSINKAEQMSANINTKVTGWGTKNIYVQPNTPSNPSLNDLWVDTDP